MYERHRSLSSNSPELLLLSGDVRCFQMAETPIESFCINLLSLQNKNIDESKDFYTDETVLLKKNDFEEISKHGKIPPSSWIRTVFLTAILYARNTAICLLLLFLLLCVVRLSLLPNSRLQWTEIIIQPITSILLCMFPLSFSLPFSLLLVESTTTAGFLATTEVILRSDENGNKCNSNNNNNNNNSYINNNNDDNNNNNMIDKNSSSKSNKNSENDENKKSPNTKNEKKNGNELITGKKKSVSDLGTSCPDFPLVNNPLRSEQYLNGREAGKYGSQDRLNNELSNNNDNNNNNNSDSNDKIGKKRDNNNKNNDYDIELGKDDNTVKSNAETHKSGQGKYSIKSSSKDDGTYARTHVYLTILTETCLRLSFYRNSFKNLVLCKYNPSFFCLRI